MQEFLTISPAADARYGIWCVSSQAGRLACVRAAGERTVLWRSTWMIHNANHLRTSRDGLRVGGHQASYASLVTLMTVHYFDVLRPQDRVAVEPNASPIFHAIQYILGRQTFDKLERFRVLVAQLYPSRTEESGDVDFGLAVSPGNHCIRGRAPNDCHMIVTARRSFACPHRSLVSDGIRCDWREDS